MFNIFEIFKSQPDSKRVLAMTEKELKAEKLRIESLLESAEATGGDVTRLGDINTLLESFVRRKREAHL